MIEIIVAIVALLMAIYHYHTSRNYWSSKGVPGPTPLPLVGNYKNVLLNKISFGDLVAREYKNYRDKPVFGMSTHTSFVLVVNDPDLIKDVLIKNFAIFPNRSVDIDNTIEPLYQNLFFLESTRWKPLRSKLTPIFTSGKLKDMFYLLLECAEHLESYLDSHIKKDPIIECRDLTAKFTTDVIGVCAFGLQMNAISEEDSEFRQIGRKIFEMKGRRLLKQRMRGFNPLLLKIFGPFLYDHEVNDFFIKIMKDTMEYRRNNNVKRHDFVDVLIDLKDNPGKINDFEMTDIMATAQAFVFFVAGFETSSTTMSHALYELALNQSMQDELKQEIIEDLESNKGELKYENIKHMQYLQKIFCETLRKYPPVTLVLRKSVQPYTFPGINLTIPKDTKVWISTYGIHHNPDYYPDPETFDPERFSEENIKLRHPSTYIPFGDGPRNCIGARFALNQTKVGLITILKNYRVDVCDETAIPYVNNPRSVFLAPIGGIKLKFTKL